MKRLFARRGFLALDPKAYGVELDDGAASEDAFRTEDDVAIVTVRGPLTHHREVWFDSYDAVKERVAAALASSCKAVLLEIDSPGGDVAGCYETARELREMANAAGKPLGALASGMAASGGYALACAADIVSCPETSFVGSIGVIETLMDHVAADKAYGLNVAVVASGERKADGHPCTPLTTAAVAEAQRRVNSLAQGFFDLVAELRGIDPKRVRSLEAGLFHGAAAVSAGLADVVMTRSQLLAKLASGGMPAVQVMKEPPAAARKESTMKPKATTRHTTPRAAAHAAPTERTRLISEVSTKGTIHGAPIEQFVRGALALVSADSGTPDYDVMPEKDVIALVKTLLKKLWKDAKTADARERFENALEELGIDPWGTDDQASSRSRPRTRSTEPGMSMHQRVQLERMLPNHGLAAHRDDPEVRAERQALEQMDQRMGMAPRGPRRPGDFSVVFTQEPKGGR